MSVKSVKQVMQSAVKQPEGQPRRVTLAEAKSIVAEAAKGKVTKGELAQVRAFVDRGLDPSTLFTTAVGEVPADSFLIDDDARRYLLAFVQRNNPGPNPSGGGGAVTFGADGETPFGAGPLGASIRGALKPGADGLRRLTDAEAKAVVSLAERGSVTAAEREALSALLANATDPGTLFTMAVGEVPQDTYFIDDGARATLRSFLDRHPAGDR